MTPMEYFVDRIDILPNGCWQWLRSLGAYGYGRYAFENVREPAHRFAYKVYVGEIPPGLTIDHLCRNRGCVNPEHLEPVTARENIMRSPIAPGAVNARKTHCIRGHEFTKENTLFDRGGAKRVCRSCRKLKYKYIGNEYHRAWRANRKSIGVFAGRIERK